MQSASEVADKWRLVREGLDRVIMGQESVKEQLLVCLLAGGHALLEGVPGTGKTLLALTLSRLLGSRFRRIQFTPDLMPADLLGTSIYNQKSQDFEFRAGPIFADLLLADEINRTPPRTQAALLESMQEKAVTLDGVRRVISPIFTVLATQNPVEFEGTYPLPEAQRDRFLLKISIDYPEKDEEAQMLSAYAGGRKLHEDAVRELSPVLSPDE
ncbi:MAG: AAA family ATPase, partial [Thermoanaerobaculia bacterium]